MRKVFAWMRKEIVLCIAVLCAIGSLFFMPPSMKYLDYIDFRTLAILFSLMAVMAGLKSIGVFEVIARTLLMRVHHIMGVEAILVALCFFFSMLITNDVALITFVPLTLELLNILGEDYARRYRIRIVMMQTIAANLGSMLTPLGNPQNLYLYGLSQMDLGVFFMTMLPYTLASLVGLGIWIVGSNLHNLHASLCMTSLTHSAITSKRQLVKYLILFVLCLLSVLRIAPYYIPFGVILLTELITNRKVLARIDYALLGTFVALFIFIGNVGQLSGVAGWLKNVVGGHEVVVAIGASQVMSNVPAAILLSGFTTDYTNLMIGVNIGGLGTLIASMASLISYKLLAKEAPKEKMRYLGRFTLMSLVFLAGLLGVWLIRSL